MAYVFRKAGVVAGVFANPQAGYAEEVMADDHPEVIAYLNPPPLDLSDIDNLGKIFKALALCVAQIGGLTVTQMKALFKAKWDALP